MTAPYPPSPWDLRGQMYLSVWRVPRAALPTALPPEVRPIMLGGKGFVGTAWVDYAPEGVLSYRELLAAVLVHRRGRPLVTITHIWVDSAASRDGGRQLWGIPKELADFVLTSGRVACAEAHMAGQRIASAAFRGRRILPGRWPVRFSVAQSRGDRFTVSPVRAAGRPQPGVARWEIEPDGPLGYLSGLRPFLTAGLRDFRTRFGRP